MSRISKILDKISSDMKKENELPSLQMLEEACELLYFIRTETEERDRAKLLRKSWPVNFRIIIRRLLQTRAVALGGPSTSQNPSLDQYLPLLFEMSDELISLIGYQWFESDPDFLLLLASLSSVRLQYAFSGEIDKEAYVHGRLHCHFILCGEDADIISDDKATKLCGILRDSAVHTCEFYQKCYSNPGFSKNVVIATFQFLYAYIDFGGLPTIPREYTSILWRILLSLAVNCSGQSLIPLECFANMIPKLPNLPNTTMGCIVEALKLRSNKRENKEIIIQTVNILIECADSKFNWYTEQSLGEAKNILKDMNKEEDST